VLDIARIEAGRLTISLEPVSLPDVVGEILDLAAPLAAEMNVQFSGGEAIPTGTSWPIISDSSRSC